MSFFLSSWNVNPNRVWFVRMADAGIGISVELYLSQADAEARVNLQASGSTSGFGSDLPVALTSDPEAAIPVSLYQDGYAWHLKASGADGDETKIFQVKEFVDLEEISHPIFRNSDLVAVRATAEIDAHTHAKITKELDLGSHIPLLDTGHTVRLNSARRGKDEILQVLEHRITGEVSDSGETKLVSNLTAAQYLPLKR